jgi:diaminopimelate decarboxylase
VVEPGRALVAPFGVLVARVVQQKQSGERRWCMIDAGMNDLVRPALYGARHRVEPVDRAPGGAEWHVVGPVCESADDFGMHALGEPLPAAVVIRDAGAYGFTMSTTTRPRWLPRSSANRGASTASARAPAWLNGCARASAWSQSPSRA